MSNKFRLFGVSGAFILIIIVRVLAKDFFIKDKKKDLADLSTFNEALKTAKNNKDSISVFLKYNKFTASDLVDSIYKNNSEMNVSLIRLLESGVPRKVIDSILMVSYPYPVYNLYIDKAADEVIRRNKNLTFNDKNVKLNSDSEFAICVKKSLGSISGYTYVFNEDKNLLIYKDLSWFKNTEYIFARNGEFCYQDANGQRDYGKWKCFNENYFECYINREKIKDTLYFDREHEIINSKHFPKILFE